MSAIVNYIAYNYLCSLKYRISWLIKDLKLNKNMCVFQVMTFIELIVDLSENTGKR